MRRKPSSATRWSTVTTPSFLTGDPSPHVTALDGEGKELWTIETDHGGFLQDLTPDSELFVMGIERQRFRYRGAFHG